MNKVTTSELKRINRKNVYHFIYNEGKTTKQNIAVFLGLSLPTVSQILTELEAEKLIERNGTFASSGGRKPMAICPVRKLRVSIGLEITKHHLQLVCVDLYGAVLAERRVRLLYDNEASYYRRMGGEVQAFAESLDVPAGHILGAGIAIQGIVSSDGQYVAYGKIMNCSGAALADFARYIPFPCALMHDSESAANAELWVSRDIRDAIYLSLSKHLGSALIMNGAIHKGHGIGSGLVEHMILQPDGRPCYCGKRGCLEAYCSTEALLGEADAHGFFEKARSAGTQEHIRWEEYLDTLSSAIDNMHMVVDCEVILGGHLGPYITDEEVARLNQQVKEKCAFPEERSYLRRGHCPESVVAIGAALVYVREFLENI